MPETVIFDSIAEVPNLEPHHNELHHMETTETEAYPFGLDISPELEADYAANYGQLWPLHPDEPDNDTKFDNNHCAVSRIPVVTVAVAVVPDTDNNVITDEPSDDNFPPSVASGIEELKIPPVKRRRKKRETPATAKTAAWLARRKKNNEVAALYREKERIYKLASKQAFEDLVTRNAELRVHVSNLESRVAALHARKAQLNEALQMTNDIFDGLHTSEYSLTPPELPWLM